MKRSTIRSFIQSFGYSAASAAKRLRTLRVKGRRKSAISCPIARAFEKKLGTNNVCVSGDCIYINNQRFQSGSGILKFVQAFDSGRYKEFLEVSK